MNIEQSLYKSYDVSFHYFHTGASTIARKASIHRMITHGKNNSNRSSDINPYLSLICITCIHRPSPALNKLMIICRV